MVVDQNSVWGRFDQYQNEKGSFMKLFKAIAIIATLWCTAQANAQSGLRLGYPTANGTGCPTPDSVAAILSPGEDAVSVLFSQFQVEAGRQIGRPQSPVCLGHSQIGQPPRPVGQINGTNGLTTGRGRHVPLPACLRSPRPCAQCAGHDGRLETASFVQHPSPHRQPGVDFGRLGR